MLNLARWLYSVLLIVHMNSSSNTVNKAGYSSWGFANFSSVSLSKSGQQKILWGRWSVGSKK